MPSYLVEAYLADTSAAPAEAQARAQLAAESDDRVRHIRTIFLPSDEVVLHMFEAPSEDALRRAAGRVELPYVRIVEAREASLTPEGGRYG